MEANTKLTTKDQPTTRPRVNWTATIIFLFVANILLWSDRSNFGVAVAVWRKDYHWTPVIIGAMGSAFTLGYMLLQPLGGWLSDKLGIQRMTTISVSGWSLFTLLTPLAPAALFLTGAFRAMLGVFEAPFNPALASIVGRAVPDKTKRGWYNAFLQSGSELGPAIGVSLSGVLASFYGTASIFIFFGGIGILMALGWWAYNRNRSEPRMAVQSEEQKIEAAERERIPEYPVSKILSSGTIWALILSYFSLPYSIFMFLAWLPVYLTQYRHFSLIKAGFLSAVPYLCAFVAYLFVGWMSDAMTEKGWTRDGFNRKLPLWIGTVIYVVSLPFAATTPSPMGAVWWIALASVGLAFIVTPYWTMVTDIAPRQAGTISGFMNFFGILGGTTAPILTGYLVAVTHDFIVAFWVSASVILAAGIVIALFVRVKPLSQLISVKN